MVVNVNDKGLITLEKRAQLKPYQPRPFEHREFLTDEEILANAGGTLFLNVESYPNYFLITFKLHTQNKFIQLEIGEGKSFNPQFLSWLMHSYKTVGFNSFNYDLLVIWLAYRIQDVGILKDATNDIILRDVREWELKKEYKFQTFKTSHIDLIEVAPLKGSLKLYGARLHCPSIQEQPFDVDKDLSEFEISELKKFNCNQVCITELLYDFMKERLDLRESLTNEYHIDVMSKSDAQIAEAIISKEVSKLNGKNIERPNIEGGTVYRYSVPHYLQYATKPMQDLLDEIRKAKFILGDNGKMIAPPELDTPARIGKNTYSLGIGGLHSVDKCKAYVAGNGKKIKDIDVTSYYPNAILNMKLYPSAMGPNFLTIYEGFKIQRVDAKRLKQFTKDKGLKIFLNGVSGKFSDYYSKMYAPANTIQMNLTGQLSMLMLAEMFECNDIEVISANTDGITVYYDEDKEDKVIKWIKYWEKITNFQLEDVDYLKYYARDVNAYFAVKTDGKVKIKGPYSEVGSQSGTKLDTNPTTLICTDAIEALLSKGTPIEETIRNCKDFTRFVNVRNAKAPGAHKNGEYLGKVLRWYYAKGEVGAIYTVAHNSKVADSDGAKPCMDLPKAFPDDIDYQWYERKCKTILEEIGYSPKPKQISFF